MADALLTAAQAAAVADRGGALLVSAAAGSGKTRVLVERLMERVCDPVNPRDIHEFLIITYTRAAAAELRGKISAALSQRLAGQPGNRHLQRQLSLVYAATISTVHAFCGDLLRSYAHLLDLPSDFRVVEESESAQILERCLEQTLEEAYGALDGDAELRALIDVLGAGRADKGAAEAVRALYRAARCHPDPDGWLGRVTDSLDLSQYGGCETTPWGAELIARLRDFAAAQAGVLDSAREEMAGVEKVERAYGPAFEELAAFLRALERLSGWDEISAALAVPPPRLKPVRAFEDQAFLERLKGARKRCLDGLQDWRGIFSEKSAAAMADLAQSAEALRGAVRLAGRLGERFAAEKRRRRMLDFGDLEHEAIRLLTDRYTGRPTAAAREVASRYAEVLVDEYQDSNEIQERIFAALSPDGRGRFLVGDVKQSIYRFRLADPSIFLHKYKTYAPAARARDGEPRKLLLSENFRSRPEILEAVNDVFRAVMSEKVGGLAYGGGEALRPGLTFPPAAGPPVELHCLKTGGEDGSPDKNRTEARFVARRIADLLAGGRLEEGEGTRPVRPDDIVILLRSVGPAAPDYLEALRAHGIPCVSDRGESALDGQAAEVFLSILQIIDNPHRDVPLAAALASPVFGFTADELAALRVNCRKGDLYDALCASADDERTAAFLSWLEPLREEARWLPLHTLLRRVYSETGIEAVYGARGGRLRAELQTVFHFAASCAAGDSPTLAQFLAHVESLRVQNAALPLEETGQGGAVRIMSVHKSKGLEFPVVILAGLSRRFNVEDTRRQMLTHPELLAASSALDREHGVRYPTFAKRAVAMRIAGENLSEELRVLYVAMTRAQSRLIMTYCSKYLEGELAAIAAEAASPAAPDFAARARNPGCWVLTAAVLGEEAGELHALGGRPRAVRPRAFPWLIRFHETVEDTPLRAAPAATAAAAPPLPLPDEATLRARLSARYAHPGVSLVPSKLTATQLKGRALDREAREAAETMPPHTTRTLRRPDFAREGRTLTAAERGTANHLFLQFADYAACQDAARLDAEVRRMTELEFLTPEQAGAVAREQLLRLFSSPLGWKLLHGEVRREFKFSLLIDAGLYDRAAAGEKIMLQGVVDCLLIEPEGLTVVDFKTDAVAPGREGERAARYEGQMRAYALAVGRIFGRPVRRCVLYFLKTGAEVAVAFSDKTGYNGLSPSANGDAINLESEE